MQVSLLACNMCAIFIANSCVCVSAGPRLRSYSSVSRLAQPLAFWHLDPAALEHAYYAWSNRVPKTSIRHAHEPETVDIASSIRYAADTD